MRDYYRNAVAEEGGSEAAVDLGHEAACLKPVNDVRAVVAEGEHLAGTPESVAVILRRQEMDESAIDHARSLDGRTARERNGEDQQAAGSQDTVQFAEGCPVVSDVLHDFCGRANVERTIWEGEALHVLAADAVHSLPWRYAVEVFRADDFSMAAQVRDQRTAGRHFIDTAQDWPQSLQYAHQRHRGSARRAAQAAHAQGVAGQAQEQAWSAQRAAEGLGCKRGRLGHGGGHASPVEELGQHETILAEAA